MQNLLQAKQFMKTEKHFNGPVILEYSVYNYINST